MICIALRPIVMVDHHGLRTIEAGGTLRLPMGFDARLFRGLRRAGLLQRYAPRRGVKRDNRRE